MRVFICAVGACGFTGWAMKEMPLAQKRGSWSAPGICLANSGAKVPCTVEMWQPTFSNTRPAISAMTPPPPSEPSFSVRVHVVLTKRPGAWPSQPGRPSASSSIRSSAAQSSSRKCSNHRRARSFRAGLNGSDRLGSFAAVWSTV